ncbi:hypothetical protein BDV96DRAFT_686741 [Lophiotrema nucula]|uniref:Uncharacterized protein n=1 Tax=Lophiotrema nucula TaxID=690887 RepID=A0A6A5ZA06_9PLEO|nr:hypothetical protein BDV96DRAFT_686741 [Lophiotrema nucula]
MTYLPCCACVTGLTRNADFDMKLFSVLSSYFRASIIMSVEKEYTVVVTGATGFKGHEKNPTQNVKQKLPDTIKRDGKSTINIIKYPFDFRNVLEDEDRIPPMWNQSKKVYDPDCDEDEKIYIDAMIHLGMAPDEDTWRIEKRARRDGYDWVGDDDIRLPKHNGGKDGMFEGLPEVLTPDYDVDEVAKQVKEDLPDIPIRA